MALHFRDATGTSGRIRDDLTVDYDGPVPVEAFVDRVEDDAASRAAALEEHLLTMPRDLAVEAVWREDAPDRDG